MKSPKKIGRKFSHYGLCTLMLSMQFSCAHKLGRIYNKEGKIRGVEEVDKSWELKHNQSLTTNTKQDYELTYFGCGGFLIGSDQHSVLIDPFFSNPSLLRQILGKIKTDTTVINDSLKPYQERISSTCGGILVAHAHYDHLMDVPYVFTHFVTDTTARIIGSNSVDALVGNMAECEVENIERYACKGENPTPVYLRDSAIRVTPLVSMHAPHYFLHIKMYGGEAKQKEKYKDPLSKSRATWWKEGQTYAYIFDFMTPNKNKIDFRVYIESSAAKPDWGYPTKAVMDQHPIDLALLGAASFRYTDQYPEGIIDTLQPQLTLICHWEDFFRDYRKRNKVVRLTNLRKFVKRLHAVYPWKDEDDQKRWYLVSKGNTLGLTPQSTNE